MYSIFSTSSFNYFNFLQAILQMQPFHLQWANHYLNITTFQPYFGFNEKRLHLRTYPFPCFNQFHSHFCHKRTKSTSAHRVYGCWVFWLWFLFLCLCPCSSCILFQVWLFLRLFRFRKYARSLYLIPSMAVSVTLSSLYRRFSSSSFHSPFIAAE